MAEFWAGFSANSMGRPILGCDPFASLAASHAVLCALSACDAVTLGDVEVSVNEDIVTLSGFVHSSGDDERAVMIAEAMVGVGRVRNRLVLVTVTPFNEVDYAHPDR